MSLNPRYDGLVRDMARSLGKNPDTVFREEGLLLDGFIVALAYEGSDSQGDILFVTELGVPRPSREREVHRALLCANNLWVGSSGTTLGIQAETGCAVICARLNVGLLDGEDLAEIVKHFVLVARMWQMYVTDAIPKGIPPPLLGATRA